MSQSPDIKPELNRGQQPEQEEKKRSGFFANLSSKLMGGSQATGGLGGGAAVGGLLATKAGIIALAIIGTTVAGGIGYVGYRAMTPSSEPQTLSIFDARPKSAVPADGAEGQKGSADGVSGSLDMFAKANTPGDEKAPDAAAAAPEPAAQASASPALAPVDHGDASLSGKAASMPKPQFSGKIGQLSGASGGSGTSASSGAGSAGSPQFAAGKKGNISAMSGGSGARAVSTGAALKALRRGGGYRTLAASALRDNRGARSSAAGGRTYDGNNAAPATFGADAGVPEGGAGAGQQGMGEVAGSPSTAVNGNEHDPAPPPPPAKDVTPWSKEINMAKMLLMGSAALLFLATQMSLVKSKTAPFSYAMTPVMYALIAIGGLMALAAMVIGFQVLGGKFGQKGLGTIFALSGGLLTVVAAGLLIDSPTSQEKGSLLGTMEPWMQICGVVGLVGVMSTQFLKPKEISCDKCKGDKSCKKYCFQMPGGAPSDRAMERFIV